VPPVVKKTARGPAFTVDNSRSLAALATMMGGVPKNAYILGVTHAEPELSIVVNGKIFIDNNTRMECMVPQFDVNLWFASMVVYVGSEFVPGTCAYDEVLAHEMRHVNTYLAFLPKVETVVRDTLRKRFDGKPLYARSGQARSLMQRDIDINLKPWIKRELGKVEIQQRAIDTAHEYARLSKVCEGEVQSLIGPAQ
jgi:hypothetical protein